MTDYLSNIFKDDHEFINTFDELPLWSAHFGILLFKHLVLKSNITVVDIGSGAGFPLMELAERLGKSCKLYGVDPWTNANNRARQKIKNYGINNVEIIESTAEQMPFESNSVDLIVSNLGINNFEQPNVILKECGRILKSEGKLALTTNLNGHWIKFYNIFEETLKELGKHQLIVKLIEHQENRGTVKSVSTLFIENGFEVSRHFEEQFEMKFNDGSAFLNHHFIKLGWLKSWRDLLPKQELVKIFSALEKNLNEYSNKSEGLTLTVPMLFMEGKKE